MRPVVTLAYFKHHRSYMSNNLFVRALNNGVFLFGVGQSLDRLRAYQSDSVTDDLVAKLRPIVELDKVRTTMAADVLHKAAGSGKRR
jgi:hypothetical protein